MIKILFLAAIASLIPLFFLFAFALSEYQKLAALRRGIERAFADLVALFKRRHELVPKLEEEAGPTFGEGTGLIKILLIARQRASAACAKAAQNPGDATAMEELAAAEAALDISLDRVFAYVGALPSAAAVEGVDRVIEELVVMEKRNNEARLSCNDAVQRYNLARGRFPGRFLAVACRYTAVKPPFASEPKTTGNL